MATPRKLENIWDLNKEKWNEAISDGIHVTDVVILPAIADWNPAL